MEPGFAMVEYSVGKRTSFGEQRAQIDMSYQRQCGMRLLGGASLLAAELQNLIRIDITVNYARHRRGDRFDKFRAGLKNRHDPAAPARLAFPNRGESFSKNPQLIVNGVCGFDRNARLVKLVSGFRDSPGERGTAWTRFQIVIN